MLLASGCATWTRSAAPSLPECRTLTEEQTLEIALSLASVETMVEQERKPGLILLMARWGYLEGECARINAVREAR